MNEILKKLVDFIDDETKSTPEFVEIIDEIDKIDENSEITELKNIIAAQKEEIKQLRLKYVERFLSGDDETEKIVETNEDDEEEKKEIIDIFEEVK